ncbi:hypothetical protein, partial [Streptomyces violaceorubidus]
MVADRNGDRQVAVGAAHAIEAVIEVVLGHAPSGRAGEREVRPEERHREPRWMITVTDTAGKYVPELSDDGSHFPYEFVGTVVLKNSRDDRPGQFQCPVHRNRFAGAGEVSQKLLSFRARSTRFRWSGIGLVVPWEWWPVGSS